MSTFMNRRRWLTVAAAATSGIHMIARAQAAASRIYVGFPPGGTADSLARLLAPAMTASLGTVIVENKAGASGQLAASAVKNSDPDGATLLLTPSSVLSLAPHLYAKPAYDSLRDFGPIAAVCDHSFALAVPGSSDIRTLEQFIAWAKASPPEAASFASPGAGTAPHFLGTLFGRAAGVQMTHVPYKGVAPGLQDLIGGQVASTVNPLPTMIEYHRGGRIRILAVTSPRRLASLPDVPTFTELRFPAVEYVEWYGIFASARTPAATIKRLQGAVTRAISSRETVDAAKRLELEPRFADAAALRKMLEEDNRRWGTAVRSTGIRLDS